MTLAVALGLAIAAVAATVAALSGRPGGSVGPEPVGSPVATAPDGGALLVGAGDIASCANDHDAATARLVERLDAAVFTAGDNAYEAGTRQEYADCYGPTWGRFRDRTHPVPGNHDYVTAGASGYFGYFGAAVGAAGRSWYAYEVNGWRVYALDSDCQLDGGCDDGSPELAWLRADLAAHPTRCVLAIWHHPRFSSGRHGDDPAVQPLWAALVAAGADVVVAGHDHLYERFARRGADGAADPSGGIREFVVGTGGRELYEFHSIGPTSEVRDASTYGVLALTLWPDRYAWRFLPAEGATFTDSGSESCH